MYERTARSHVLFPCIPIGIWFSILVAARVSWFAELGFPNVYLYRLGWQLALGIGGGTLSLLFILGNLQLARRLRWPSPPGDGGGGNPALVPSSRAIPLVGLLGLALAIALGIGLMLIYHAYRALEPWIPSAARGEIASALSSLPGVVSLAALCSPVLLLLVRTHLALRVFAILISFFFAGILGSNWTTVLQSLNATPFDKLDPQFGRDIGFYIFQLPLWQLLESWWGALTAFTLLAVLSTYLFSAGSLSEGRFPGFSRPQLQHLYVLWGTMMAILAFHHAIGRYSLLYSDGGAIYGAGYTEIHVGQWVEVGSGAIAALTGFWLFWEAFAGERKSKSLYRRSRRQRTFSPFLIAFSAYLAFSSGGRVVAIAVQRAIVQPNELARERPYIERGIAFTREAFALARIDSRAFDPRAELSPEVLERNYSTIHNIRLWDTVPLLATNRQLQQIRLYYKFPDADYDRYQVKVESRERSPELSLSEKQQTIIAARELDYGAIPVSANTWVNERLVYTHGYGFTLSPVNLVGEGGLPYYFVKDIGTEDNQGDLRTSSESIRYSIPIDRPRIYYGELTDNYVMAPTRVRELDFPSGESNVYNLYDGSGGIPIGSPWRRWLFALYLRDWQMLFSRDFTPGTKLLMTRNIRERVREIAPFLRFDRDPYLVAAEVGENRGKLHWIIDAYTTSDRYPYSAPGKEGFNYIRNSVKVVVDAYNGSVDFYVADPDDPIVRTWSKIFPRLFKPLAAMPRTLFSHIRYPEDFFRTQSERLLIYHMTDPQTFYNREDLWEIPQEIYGTEQQEVKPYYLIMKLPGTSREEFVLLHPYTPSGRQNLTAWLAARSDAPYYGNLALYQFPKQRLIYGPNQIEALINQDPDISQQISLWNREGSRVLQGHLLVIPIERSLLYVEPLYLIAEQNSVPTVVRVAVVYQNRVVMEKTLREALARLFG